MRRHGIKDFNQCLTSQQFEQTYCAILRNAGYRTGFIGKHGLASFPSDGFDYYKGFPGDGSYNAIDDEGNPIHLTTLIAKQAVEFLDESKKTVPFCLSISFKAPHVEGTNTFLYDTRYEDLYQGVTIPLPATYDDQYWYAFPERFRQNNEARSRWEVRFSTPQMYQYSVKGYYRLISGVDVAVRTIMKRLRQLKLDDDTIIIITSDNGFYLAELGMAGKWYGHGPSIRVPLVIYDPRLPKSSQGRVISETALNVDIAPTILSYAGVRVPELMQGKDLSKVISGQAASWRTDFLYEQMFNYGGRIPVCEGVVQQQYKYIRFFGLSPVYEQLYDVPNDPNEIINLADDPSYASLLDQMRARCDQLIAESA
jgi:arylsulfatase A-like enzyme